MNKAELVQWLQQENQQWQALLDEIGTARMTQPGVNGDWSMKDIVAHLTSWQRKLVSDFQAAQRGEPEPPPPWGTQLQTEDEINAWIYETNRGRSVQEVLGETDQVFQQLIAAIHALPDDFRFEYIEPKFNLVWVGDKRFAIGEFFHHFEDDHESDVRAWLARQDKKQGRQVSE